ncbi:unnamed protein product [Phytophthora lilii]|uniref:Unnamed protein product n=1 Tax=Phytophthora lilii TaxID=2077276 RepID=A0A9W6XDP5_9STRA|nr:unnamed protein product [Phytophthora lilii]
MANESDVVDQMREDYKDAYQFGECEFQSRDFANMTMYDQMRVMVDSDVVIGMHGAGMVNVIWTHPGTLVVEFSPYKSTAGDIAISASFSGVCGTSFAVVKTLSYAQRTPTKWTSAFHDVFSPAPTSDEDAEVVTFPLAPQTSQRASTKRKSLFDAALKKKSLAKSHDLPKELEKATQETDTTRASSVNVKALTKPTQIPAKNDWGSSVLTMLQQMDLYKDQIIHVERRESRNAQYRDLETLQLSTQTCEALEKCYNIKQLYSHQFEAIEAIRRGENAVLSTATASGKSLAYNVPMLDMLLEDSTATFMYLFPTKALAQDQLKSLRRLLEAAGLPLHLGATFVRAKTLALSRYASLD